MNRQMHEAVVDQSQQPHASGGRFASLLSTGDCIRPLYDKILFEVDECVVTPTLGSILPYWFLVIPRLSTANFAEWRLKTGVEPHELIRRVLAKRGILSDRMFWFEHGAPHRGSQISCGVDHAHLHIIVDAPFSFFEFASSAMNASKLSWQESGVANAYPIIKSGNSYLFAASGNLSILAEEVDTVGSQFFRRVIAALVQQPQGWNYRTHPYMDNIRETVRAFAA